MRVIRATLGAVTDVGASVVDDVVGRLEGIRRQLVEVLDNTTLSPADRVKLNNIFEDVGASKAAIAEAKH